MNPAQIERLAICAEEAGEVIQAVGKCLRHGMDSENPNIIGGGCNHYHLARELGQLIRIADWLVGHGDIYDEYLKKGYDEKMRKMREYIHCEENLK